MGMARLATVALALAAIPAFAASVVTYDLQLGGDNFADQIKAGTRVRYADGSTADGQTFEVGDQINWATTVAVSGNHEQAGHPSNGLPTQGVANIVVNVELHEGSASGPLVGEFYSSVHDGAGALPCTSCPGGDGVCAGSAFALGFQIVWGPARVTEAYQSSTYGGPFMEVCMWPTVSTGQLLGTGAGYAQWCRGCGLGSITTKGVGLPTASGGLGYGPVVEGQIDTTGLAPGTYVLKLTPSTGTNVLRGDVDLVTAPPSGGTQVQAFAVAANQAVGDTITFTLTEGGPVDPDPPVVTAAVSRKAHGTAGSFDIDLLATNPVEDRSGGPTQIVVTFNEDVQGADGLDNADVQASSGTVTGVAIASNVLTINLSGASNATQLYLGLAGIQDLAGNASTQVLCMNVLAGDANGDKSVNIFDLVQVRNALNQAVTAANFRSDTNADGSINIFDLVTVRNSLNTSASGSCP